MWGDIIIFVIYDLDELVAAAASRGLKTILFSREEDSVFELIEPITGRNIRLAWQLFDRLALEFTSPGWLLGITVERLNSPGVPSAAFSERNTRTGKSAVF